MNQLIKKFFLASAIAVMAFFLANRILFFRPGFLENVASTITYPFLWASGSIASRVTTWQENRTDYATLRTKYHNLHNDYLALLDEVIASRATEHVHAAIKPLLEFQHRYNPEGCLLAKVLVRNLSNNQHYFLVNRGTRDGVHKDMVAFYHNHLVGRVAEVYDFYSKIILITDQHCKISAYASTTNAAGIVQGYNCINRCNFSYVSHLLNVQDNDLVLSSGQGLVFPEGFCLGKIVVHTLQEKALYHHIQIEPLINLQTMSYCYLRSSAS